MLKEIRILCISNITIEPYLTESLNQCFEKNNYQTTISYLPYYEYKSFSNLNNVDFVLVFLNFDELFMNSDPCLLYMEDSQNTVVQHVLQLCENLYSFIKQSYNCPVLWIGFEDYYSPSKFVLGSIPIMNGLIDRVNLEINKVIQNTDCFIDLKLVIAKVGIDYSFDLKNKHRWNLHYSKTLIQELAADIYKQYLLIIGYTKKCLVLDCDNVLWGGILSEVGIEGICIGGDFGRAYQEFQEFLLFLYYHGIILAVCSKNDESDVLRVFREHTGMVLTEKHISCFKINWNQKDHNIRQISEDLNISLDSMVFVDDSDFEIALVNKTLPDVYTINFNKNDIYRRLSCFNLRKEINVKGVEKRTITYQTDAYRSKLKSTYNQFEEFLSALKMIVDIHPIKQDEYVRIAELTQRANKLTNGRRYRCDELQALSNQQYQFFSIELSDVFSDLGIVGAIGINNHNIDLFVLSCRALGRNIEETMMDFCETQGAKSFDFFCTGKNKKVFDLLSSEFIMNDNCN